MEPRLLLIEDTPSIAQSIQLSLKPEGIHLVVVANLEQARSLAPYSQFDLALVDVMLPDGNGLEFCTELKIANPSLHLIVITAKADEDSLVRGLAVADDYIRKPFGRRELLARIKKCMGQKVSTATQIEYAGLKLNAESGEAHFQGQVIHLRPKEFAILSVLAVHGGDFVSREQLLNHIDRDGELHDRSLDSHLSRLRRALKEANLNEVQVITSHGHGYSLKKVA